MSGGPVPFRTSNENKYTNSFPSVLYYRDTFGLEPIQERRCTDSMTTDCSDDTITTKSTVRTTQNVNQNMNESMISKITPSYHIDQILTNRILTVHPRTLLTLTLVMFATAVQLLIFATICVFFDGCPYYLGVILSGVMLANTITLFVFLRCLPSRFMLIISCIAASLSCFVSLALFFITAHLISLENERPTAAASYEAVAARSAESIGHVVEYDSPDNPIVSSTRIAMYSLQLVLSPAHAIASAMAVYVLYGNLRAASDSHVVRGYFFSDPPIGHQKILIPIELKQVRELEDDGPDNASIGVQTSGTRRDDV